MGTVVRRNIVERVLGVMSKKAMKAIFPKKSHDFQMVVLKALKDLGEKKKRTRHDIETDVYTYTYKIRNQEG